MDDKDTGSNSDQPPSQKTINPLTAVRPSGADLLFLRLPPLLF